MKTLKVLLIPPKCASGTGSGTYSHILIESLRKTEGVQIRIFSSNSDLSEEWDVVHALDLKHLEPALVSSIRAPLVIDVHDVYWLRGEDIFATPDLPARIYLSARRRRRYMPILNRAAAVITHSRYVAQKLGYPATFVIPCPVELLDPGPPLAARPLKVVYAGRDFFRKGVPVLLAAWRHVNKSCPDATLVIAGREYFHGTVYARLASFGCNVRLVGDLPRENLLDEIRQARALVLPSRTEAFGIVLIEAMALKTPAVATRVGGIPEVLEEGRIGMLVEKGDSRALARSILRCLERQPDIELIDMIEKAHKAAANYSIESFIKKVLNVYYKVSRKA